MRTPSMTSISYVQQQHITRLCVRCGLLLMQYGAESAVVVDLSKRLGLALGINSVECSLNFNAITLTTICDERCITTTRDTINQSINVNLLVQIQQIVNKTEADTDNNNDKLKSELTERTTLAFDELDKWRQLVDYRRDLYRWYGSDVHPYLPVQTPFQSLYSGHRDRFYCLFNWVDYLLF